MQLGQQNPYVPFLVLATLWLAATLLNLNKAFHIDDTFHLEAAQWIEQHPLRPMSGLINWDNNKIPIYHYNQPPLYFYLVALVGSLFGYSEIPLHLFQSLFTLLAIVCIYKIAATLYLRHALLLTALFALNPAFLVNQNLMVDIPLLSLHLLFIYILIKPDIKSAILRYILAGLVLSLALLIKYTSLPLIVLLMLVPFIRKEQKYVWVCFLPFLVLGIWSVFNYIEYASIHLHSRPKPSYTLLGIGKQLLAFLICLGSIAPFTVAFLAASSAKYKLITRSLIMLALTIILLSTYLWYATILTSSQVRGIFWVVFLVNGILAIGFVVSRHFLPFLSLKLFQENATRSIFILWAGAIGAFIILFAPFMATRHVLLIIPPLLLLSAEFLRNVSSNRKILAVALSASLSLVLGISDWVYADFYRNQPFEIMRQLPEGNRLWSVGHWGWQWYSQKAGMQLYQTDSVNVAVNDLIVAPKNVPQQVLNDALEVEKAKTIVPAVTSLTYFSTGIYAAFYTSDYIVAPWALSRAPIDTITVFRVKAIHKKQ